MIDATPRDLPQQQQGGRTGFPLIGWKGILFGLPFAGMGALLAFVTPRPGRDAPAGLVKAFGAMFFVAGAALILGGVRYYWREWRRAVRLARHRSEPWRADYAWDPRGIAGDLGRRARRAFLTSTGVATFLAPFNYIAFVDPRLHVSGIGAMRFIVAVLDLAVAASFGYSAYLLARRLEYGRTFLHFGRFPFLLGETVDLRLAPPRHARGLQELEVTLRCIEERIQETRCDRESTTYVARRQMWADTRTVQAAQLPGAGVMLSFDLPREPGLGSALSATPPRYWELSVKAAAPGVDFASTFLVPVYAHPGSVQLPA